MSMLEFLEEYVLNKLNEREKRLVFLRQKDVFGFGENKMTLSAIAETEGVTTERIRQIVAKAARRIKHRLRILAESQKSPHIIVKEVTESQAVNPPLPMRIKTVEELGEFSVRTLNCLRYNGILLVDDLMKKTERELLGIPNFGRKSLNELKGVLRDHGLKLKMSQY